MDKNNAIEPSKPPPWTQADLDTALECLLPCESETKFNRVLHELCRTTIQRPRSAVLRRVWGLAVLAHGQAYGLHSDSVRAQRAGLPYTWAEVSKIIRPATQRPLPAESMAPPSAEYIATVLCRTVEEVEGAFVKYGPAQGRKGFGLV